ncbi:SOUL family heme-binding protein [Lichenicoccus sp.]|uniref:SOUL family heme-binding protein n=1 Tax=Lichenicoccus sp. TaxID=2781899 RepID=UPI003D14DF84
MVAILSGLLTTGCSVFGIRTVHEPSYTLVRTFGPVQVRRYGPRVAAETVVEGDEVRARGAGFERLAGYIFGGNRGRQSIDMTAPVAQSARSIDMTAPVAQARTGAGQWRVQFFMPAGSTLATLPLPDNPAVALVDVPPETVAVLRYAGTPTPARVGDAEARLLVALIGSGLRPDGKPFEWFYDPPWTIPALRRNEAVVRIVAD